VRRLKSKWQDEMKTELTEIGCEDGNWRKRRRRRRRRRIMRNGEWRDVVLRALNLWALLPESWLSS
jgi:hypothetical protein